MTGIMIGFTRARHLLGTVYGNYSLTAADTGINAAGPNGSGSGDSTINLPSLPSALQAITINNTGTGTVTVSGNGNNIGGSATTTIAAGTSKWFAWGGYTWGFVFGGSCETVMLPATKDFGTTTQGPAETPYDVPADTVTYESIGYTPCGGLLRKIITTTYDGRSVADQWKASNYWINSPTFVTPYDSGLQYAYGATQTQAKDNVALKIVTLCPSMMQHSSGLIFGPTYYNLGTFDQLNGNNTVSPFQPAATILRDTTKDNLLTQVSIYYLDTNIVWTYEII